MTELQVLWLAFPRGLDCCVCVVVVTCSGQVEFCSSQVVFVVVNSCLVVVKLCFVVVKLPLLMLRFGALS